MTLEELKLFWQSQVSAVQPVPIASTTPPSGLSASTAPANPANPVSTPEPVQQQFGQISPVVKSRRDRSPSLLNAACEAHRNCQINFRDSRLQVRCCSTNRIEVGDELLITYCSDLFEMGRSYLCAFPTCETYVTKWDLFASSVNSLILNVVAMAW